jgi:hypothetical protein
MLTIGYKCYPSLICGKVAEIAGDVRKIFPVSRLVF